MARGFIRKPSFWKIVGAYRSQWKRSLMRALFPNTYGKKGMGWWTNPRKAAYNWWYRRTSVSAYDFGLFRRTRPSSVWVECAIGVGLLCSLFLLPIDVPVASRTGHKIKKQRLKRTAARIEREKVERQRSGQEWRHSASTGEASRTVSTAPQAASVKQSRPKSDTPSGVDAEKTPREKKIDSTPKRESTPKAAKQEKEKVSSVSYTPVIQAKPVELPKPQAPAEPDENTPKSKPKHEGDRYIRKRMIIAGSSYCDPAVLDKLSIGTYFDLIAEPDNRYDKNAIMLTVDGEKIGYVAKSDQMAFVTCLKLKRQVYGVITDIKADSYPIQYEYETWFEQT